MTTTMTEPVIYHGHPKAGVAVEADGSHVRFLPLTDLARSKSPTGFGWGFGGSGPAALAHSLLVDVLGDTVRCPTCCGTRQVTWDQTLADGAGDWLPAKPGDVAEGCPDCDDGLRQLPYQSFKGDVVARWPMDSEFRIGRREILMWARGYAAAQPMSYDWLSSAAWAAYA